MAFVPLIVAAIAAWYFLGDASGGIVRFFGTIGATACLAVLFFAIRMLTIPAKMHAESMQTIAILETKLSALSAVPDKKQQRLDLARLAEIGREVRRRCAQIDGDELDAEINVWANEVVQYLKTEMDDSFAFRFRSNSGFMAVDLVGGPPMTSHQRDRAIWVNNRLTRIEEFMAQLA
ncbi:hypothetical protein EN794_049855 [Mesorhizobium sp. M00.F.Ca.ET.151.01.1.1]|uniref:hypothetical protein n=1 Tax=unclassified Mesorhizobium TaxID=325217 RepID=UPI0010923826|nr:MULTISPECIES: hypothetical protein [unclassified Mesorhizobium]TGP98872.1 hypothetical protein EN861_11040 [Mesorhizobium sp. M8A.F.Ca.ET.218.01.1.1]TGT20215.1 hypothetical protein EN856_11050 [Mesorhizobium sp. M8A.F.Ca.ET.213.01.1.1]TGU88088.1 hypothetical protein EN794_049855 [Mesorhizobium sp. M00.F.Ca.ET.151.01.1.1]TIS83985.1 MAG: hypothetical protein E5W88_28940 [Mesorhizobium sp.]